MTRGVNRARQSGRSRHKTPSVLHAFRGRPSSRAARGSIGMMPIRGWTRETRLLVVTIVLSVSVLLALARLRFPGQEPRERLVLPARPLQQIVERASFDDLTNAVTRAAD